MPYLYDALEQCDDPVEATLILNTVVLLRDGANVKVDAKRFETSKWAKMEGLVSKANPLQNL